MNYHIIKTINKCDKTKINLRHSNIFYDNKKLFILMRNQTCISNEKHCWFNTNNGILKELENIFVNFSINEQEINFKFFENNYYVQLDKLILNENNNLTEIYDENGNLTQKKGLLGNCNVLLWIHSHTDKLNICVKEVMMIPETPNKNAGNQDTEKVKTNDSETETLENNVSNETHTENLINEEHLEMDINNSCGDYLE